MRSIVLGLLLLLAIGHVSNIIHLAKSDFKEPYESEVIRTVGVFIWPLGAVLGYIKIGDE